MGGGAPGSGGTDHKGVEGDMVRYLLGEVRAGGDLQVVESNHVVSHVKSQ